MSLDPELREALARAPDDYRVLSQLCDKAPVEQSPDVLQLLSTRLAAPPTGDSLRLIELRLYAWTLERFERYRRGLPTLTATSLKDTEFLFARDAALNLAEAAAAHVARKPKDVGALVMHGEALAALGRLHDAQAQFARLAGVEHVSASGSVDLDPRFHAGLDSVDPTKDLPVSTVNHTGVVGPRAIFVAGDGVYFNQFAPALLESLAQEDVSIAIHLMDCPADTIDALAPEYYVSSERTGLTGERAREHYHAVRFVRLLQFMHQNPQTAVWFIDMDSTVTGPPARLFDLLAGTDLAVHFHAARLEIRNKISAHMLGIAPTDVARRFVHRVAAYIHVMYQSRRLSWGTDQVALYAVLARFPDAITYAPAGAETGLIRSMKGG